MFERLDVWKNEGNELIVYRIFRDVNEDFYYVQSKDYIQLGDQRSMLKLVQDSENQMLQLFMEIDIKVRATGYKSIDLAINEFNNEWR